MNLLQIEGLCAGYGKIKCVQNVSMQISEGKLVGILGPNGCGKSTLLKALCKGIPYSGTVTIAERNLRDYSEQQLARICAYVPQRSGLSIDISALEVVMMGFQPYLRLLETPSLEMKERAKEILSQVGLEGQMTSNYMELSEGQKRLCVLARALVADVSLLLMDEPDAALDFNMRNTLVHLVGERVRNQQGGALIAVHDTNLALAHCDQIYLMTDGKFEHVICPKEDSLKDMESKLSEIYGAIRLLPYNKENGEQKLVMVQA